MISATREAGVGLDIDEPISDVCDEYDLTPSQFYRWQKKFFEKGDAAFRRKTGSQEFF
ncbi:MAG: transposase, partial [Planctomycetes bacterium]|nr:transposase [Planctomycetota bacterium]